MKKQLQLFLLFLVTVTVGYAQELVIVDLSVANEVTIHSTTAVSAATISGSDTTGFYLENFFASEHTITDVLVSGDFTSFLNTSDGSPLIFRGGVTTDPGLNVWTYTDDASSDFVTGTQAFSGTATWTVDPAEFTAMLAAAPTGNIYFPADDVSDVPGATLIGTYSVTTMPLSIPDVQTNNFTYYPNPVKDVWNISSQKVIDQVEVYNMLGQSLSVQKINSLNGTINTSSLAKGAYFFNVTLQDATTKTIKVIKN